jgi:glycosyltransferase involved in cell wall biosynthesis
MNDISIAPLVTVVIPTYNHAKYLGKALQSVFDQTFFNWEIVVIDNYSDDDTNLVLEEFKDSRLRTIQINNKGCIATSRNIGILNARGEWIAFLDSDDFWVPSKLEECLNASQGFDLVYHKMTCYQYSGDHSLRAVGKLDARDVSNNPLKTLKKYGPSLTTSAIMVKKISIDEVGGFDEDQNLVGGEDFDLWLNLAKNSCKFSMLDKYLAYYLVGGSHMTSARRAVKIISYLSSKHFPGPIKNRPNWMHKSMLVSHLKTHSYQDFSKYLWQMVKELSLANNLITLSLIFRTLVLGKVFRTRTIN